MPSIYHNSWLRAYSNPAPSCRYRNGLIYYSKINRFRFRWLTIRLRHVIAGLFGPLNKPNFRIVWKCSSTYLIHRALGRIFWSNCLLSSPHMQTPRGLPAPPPAPPGAVVVGCDRIPPPGDTTPGDAAHKNQKSSCSSTKLGNLCPAEKSSWISDCRL